jgi:hypothetical protein
MRGPYVITALEDDLSAITTEVVAGLHRAALRLGRQVDPRQKLLTVKTPLQVCILATTLPDQMRLTVSRLPGAIYAEQAVLIFITADGHNYMLLDAAIDVDELVAIAAQLGTDDP